MCLGCVEDMGERQCGGKRRDAEECHGGGIAIRSNEEEVEDAQCLVQCPTCMADGAFNVRNPTVSLVMCELVRFSAEISEKKKRHQEKMEKRKREKEKVQMKSDKDKKRSPVKRKEKEKEKTGNSSDRDKAGNRKKARRVTSRRSASASASSKRRVGNTTRFNAFTIDKK